MKVPHRSIPASLLLFMGLTAALFVCSEASAERAPTPQRILLDDLGFQPLSPMFMLNGSSMLTLHYVDDKHILVTFNVRRLLRRLPEEPVNDDDRSVDAVLIELPTGKILARTTWRTHDRAQYLWSLGHGDFLLRIRETLTVFSPMANLAAGHPFEQTPFIVARDRRIAMILLSPDADLMMVETLAPLTPEEQHEALLGPIADPPALKQRNSVQINFYRFERQSGRVKPVLAGAARTEHTGELAANAAGFIATVDQGHQHWAFDFHSYSGKVAELSPFDSTCNPIPILVNSGEFIAFGCHLSQGMHTLGGFNMRGEEMWEQNLIGDYLSPSLAFATSDGRFALSRVLTRSEFLPDQPISPDLVSSQTVVVMQASTGRQIFKTDCSPIARAGQNFALSPDGLSLAVVRADAIEIYPLPPLTGKEQSALKLAQASAPHQNDLPIRLNSDTETDAPTDAETAPAPSTTDAAQPAPAAASTQPETSTADSSAASANSAGAIPASSIQPVASGDDDALPGHRKPPTLYTLPTDKQQHGNASSNDEAAPPPPVTSPQ